MKIERSKLKKSSSEVPADCKNLIDKLKVTERYSVIIEFGNMLTFCYLRAAHRTSFCRN